MRLALTPHPDFPCEAVVRIEVEVARPAPGVLSLSFAAAGAIADLVLPAPAAASRTDELWRTTCFEAFLQPEPLEAYFEFNLAPSRQWAVYRFSHYRQGMESPPAVAQPVIEMRREPGRLDLVARLDLAGLPGLERDGRWRLGLSAVVEEAVGRKSYWALAHPAGRPDFHNAAGFVCEIGPEDAV
ncbi:MAG: DOMON-like domain-containing protein [Caulobacteraceae bacterium]